MLKPCFLGGAGGTAGGGAGLAGAGGGPGDGAGAGGSLATATSGSGSFFSSPEELGMSLEKSRWLADEPSGRDDGTPSVLLIVSDDMGGMIGRRPKGLGARPNISSGS